MVVDLDFETQAYEEHQFQIDIDLRSRGALAGSVYTQRFTDMSSESTFDDDGSVHSATLVLPDRSLHSLQSAVFESNSDSGVCPAINMLQTKCEASDDSSVEINVLDAVTSLSPKQWKQPESEVDPLHLHSPEVKLTLSLTSEGLGLVNASDLILRSVKCSSKGTLDLAVAYSPSIETQSSITVDDEDDDILLEAVDMECTMIEDAEGEPPVCSPFTNIVADHVCVVGERANPSSNSSQHAFVENLEPRSESDSILIPEPVSDMSISKIISLVANPVQQPDSCDQLRIAFSGIEPCDALVKKLNSALEKVSQSDKSSCSSAIIVSDVTTATHLVFESVHALKRTAKLMVALNTGIRCIVGLEWLQDSVTAGRALPVDSVVRSREGASSAFMRGYLVCDREKEIKWGVDLGEVLRLPDLGHIRVFSNCSIHVLPGVCGVHAPSASEFKDIVLSGGGNWLPTLPPASKLTTTWLRKQRDAARTLANRDGEHRFLIISHPSLDKVLSAPVKALASNTFAPCGVYFVETILLACLRQRLDLSEGLNASSPDTEPCGEQNHSEMNCRSAAKRKTAMYTDETAPVKASSAKRVSRRQK